MAGIQYIVAGVAAAVTLALTGQSAIENLQSRLNQPQLGRYMGVQASPLELVQGAEGEYASFGFSDGPVLGGVQPGGIQIGGIQVMEQIRRAPRYTVIDPDETCSRRDLGDRLWWANDQNLLLVITAMQTPGSTTLTLRGCPYFAQAGYSA